MRRPCLLFDRGHPFQSALQQISFLHFCVCLQYDGISVFSTLPSALFLKADFFVFLFLPSVLLFYLFLFPRALLLLLIPFLIHTSNIRVAYSRFLYFIPRA